MESIRFPYQRDSGDTQPFNNVSMREMALSMSKTGSSLQTHSWHFDFEIPAFKMVRNPCINYSACGIWQ